MKMFVFQSVGGVTDRYHSSGGVVVVAMSMEEAREMAAKHTVGPCYSCVWDEGEDEPCECKVGFALPDKPDYVQEVAPDAEAILFVFPNAGCC